MPVTPFLVQKKVQTTHSCGLGPPPQFHNSSPEYVPRILYDTSRALHSLLVLKVLCIPSICFFLRRCCRVFFRPPPGDFYDPLIGGIDRTFLSKSGSLLFLGGSDPGCPPTNTVGVTLYFFSSTVPIRLQAPFSACAKVVPFFFRLS